MLFIEATNVVASRLPKRRPTGTPHARANFCYIKCGQIYYHFQLIIYMTITTVCYSEPVTRQRCGITRDNMVTVAYQNYNMSQVIFTLYYC